MFVSPSVLRCFSDPRLIKEDQRRRRSEQRADATVQANSLISGLQEEITAFLFSVTCFQSLRCRLFRL